MVTAHIDRGQHFSWAISSEMKQILNFVVVLICGLAAATLSVSAQTPVPPQIANYQPLNAQQLNKLLGPIALYPDPLIAVILPAATLPTQIVLADRYVQGGGDPNQIEQQPWDPSVQALAHYPAVLKWMDDNLNWTTVLGDAFLNQQGDVMDAIQSLRASAQNLGNLQSTPQQQVTDDGGNIEIVPSDPETIYVPAYDPDAVYYQSPVGPPFITFGAGFGIGPWLCCDFDWANDNLIVWRHDHPRPRNWWHERGNQRLVVLSDHGTVWHPAGYSGVGRAGRGDRGWDDNSGGRRNVPALNRQYGGPQPAPARLVPNQHTPRQNIPDVRGSDNHFPDKPIQMERPVQRPAQDFAPVNRPPASDTFIGFQSSHDARNFSDRGQQSRQTITHSEPQHSGPVSRPAPSFSGGNGGGGGHGAARH
jgi:hypothetical protein